MAPIPVEHSYIVPTGQTYYQSGQQQMYPVGQYGHEVYGWVVSVVYTKVEPNVVEKLDELMFNLIFLKSTSKCFISFDNYFSLCIKIFFKINFLDLFIYYLNFNYFISLYF